MIEINIEFSIFQINKVILFSVFATIPRLNSFIGITPVLFDLIDDSVANGYKALRLRLSSDL